MGDYMIQTWSVPQSKWVDRLAITTNDFQSLLDQANAEQTTMTTGTRWRIIQEVPMCADNIK